MAKKNQKNKARKQAKKAMKKRQKDIHRKKTHSSTVMSENAVQHQMISSFGNVQNFVKAVQGLGELFKSDEDLSKIRFDADKVYEKIDLAEMRDALEDMYADEDYTVYDEEYEPVWKDKRKEVLDDFLTEEFVEKVRLSFEKLSRTKKGHKKEYRAVMAGKLLLESHIYSMTESPAHENALWEVLYNAALKENKKELPEKVEKPEETAEEPAAEAVEEKSTEEAEKEE